MPATIVRFLGNDFTWWGCLGHTLQLCVQDSKKLKDWMEDFNYVRNLVSTVRSSVKPRELLRRVWARREEKNVNDAPELILDVPTRWHSTLGMLERLLRMRHAIEDPEFQVDGERVSLGNLKACSFV
jgi:hypothetical protein